MREILRSKHRGMLLTLGNAWHQKSRRPVLCEWLEQLRDVNDIQWTLNRYSLNEGQN